MNKSNALDQFKRFLVAKERIILTAADLDGDSIGTLVALEELIRQLMPSLEVDVRLESEVPNRYRFLMPESFTPSIGTRGEDWSNAFAVVVDSEPSRYQRLGGTFASAGLKGLVDHHQTTVINDFDFVLYDPSSPSTTKLVYDLYLAANLRPSKAAASALYAGLVFDTSIFRYKLTSPGALRMAADLMTLGIDHAGIVERLLLVQPLDRVQLRAKVLSSLTVSYEGRFCCATLEYRDVLEVDSGGLVDDLIFIEGVEVAALIIALANGDSRISLRSRCEIDVAGVANCLDESGGGHIRAAGVTLSMSLSEAREALDQQLDRLLKAQHRSSEP